MTIPKNAKVVLSLRDWYNFKEIAKVRSIDYDITHIDTTHCKVEVEANKKELEKLGY